VVKSVQCALVFVAATGDVVALTMSTLPHTALHGFAQGDFLGHHPFACPGFADSLALRRLATQVK